MVVKGLSNQEYFKTYYLNNKDRIKANHKKWVNKRREYIREYMKNYMMMYRQTIKKKRPHLQQKIEPLQYFNIKFSHKPIMLYF